MLPPEYRDDEIEILPAVDYEFYLGVLELINSGALDRYLHRLLGVIKTRQAEAPLIYVGSHREPS